MDLQTPTPEPQRRKRATAAPLPELPAPNKTSVANQVCWTGGVLILATGLVGFVVPGLFLLHLNPVHNLILIVSGILALWFGITAPDYTTQRFSRWFGGFYVLIGVAGFAFGYRALSLTRPTSTGMPEETAFLWQLVPGHFELGTADHILHLIIGAVFLTGAYFTLRGYRHKVTWH